MNCWVVAKNLRQMADTAPTSPLGRIAGFLLEEYTYPVDTIVLGPDLKVLGQLSVNEAFADPAGYGKVLEAALARGDETPASGSLGESSDGA